MILEEAAGISPDAPAQMFGGDGCWCTDWGKEVSRYSDSVLNPTSRQKR